MLMVSKSDFTQEEKDTIRNSKESCTTIKATTEEEVTVHVKDLDMLITVQL